MAEESGGIKKNNYSKQYIETELIAIVKQLLKESGEIFQRDIKLEASLQRHLGIDSLSRAELFQRIGKKFQVDISDHLLMTADTLNDIATYLCSDVSGIKLFNQHAMLASHGERPHLDMTSATSLVDVLLRFGQEAPDKVHVYFQDEDGRDEVITYGQLLRLSSQVSNGLRERGLKEGETVAIMQPTTPGFFYTFFGILLAGGIPVPIYPPFRLQLLERMWVNLFRSIRR